MDYSKTARLVAKKFKNLQQVIIQELSAASGDNFGVDDWSYASGQGGGRTCTTAGAVIEKGGVNFSAVAGRLTPKIAQPLKLADNADFFATGLSLVLHPLNPFVPTVHMNVRYFETSQKWWFGGGIDLTPYYPQIADVRHFHQQLKDVCDRFDPHYYQKFKNWCDEYFFIKHRQETRGVGGIFFDQLNSDWEHNFKFSSAVGEAFTACYGPIFNKHKKSCFNQTQREFQSFRRGRYVEFNLVYDRGTLFGLETQGRIESILMSLPPVAHWKYDWQPTTNSPEAKLQEFLKPQPWL